jgi:hypothetical protein
LHSLANEIPSATRGNTELSGFQRFLDSAVSG